MKKIEMKKMRKILTQSLIGGGVALASSVAAVAISNNLNSAQPKALATPVDLHVFDDAVIPQTFNVQPTADTIRSSLLNINVESVGSINPNEVSIDMQTGLSTHSVLLTPVSGSLSYSGSCVVRYNLADTAQQFTIEYDNCNLSPNSRATLTPKGLTSGTTIN